MAKADGVFVYVGTYASEVVARDDYAVVKDLHALEPSAPTTRPSSPRTPRARSTSTRTRPRPVKAPGAEQPWVPSSASSSRRPIIAGAVVGATAGGVSGHLWKGMSRSDVKEFGDIIDAGQAALVIVGESTIEDAIEKADLKAEKHAAKELDVTPRTSTRPYRTPPRKSAEPPPAPSVRPAHAEEAPQ